MALTYGFFNSINGDRKYNANDISNYFDGLVSDGVYQNVGNGMAVTAGSGMNVNVASGRALINCKWLKNDSVYNLPINPANATMPRYTAVLISMNNSSRNMSIITIDGQPASSPVKPSIPTSQIAEYLLLAYIYVPANASSISQSNITDQRGTSLCPWVSSLNANALIQEYTKRVVLATGTSNIIPLNMSGYTYDSSDIISVFINGLHAAPNVDYYLDTTQTPVKLHPNASASGTEIYISIIKSKSGFTTT